MHKKYRHINLPKNYISISLSHTPARHPFPDVVPEFEKGEQKRRISKEFENFKSYSSSRSETLLLNKDKKSVDLKIKFYGRPKPEFLEKYGIFDYKKIDSSTVFGKISIDKIFNQNSSDMERLSEDLNGYTTSDYLTSYFGKIEEIKPLTLEEVLDTDLKIAFQEDSQKERIVDITFMDTKEDVNRKFQKIREEYDSKFISEINSDLVHFCRLSLNYNQVKEIKDKFNGIVGVESSPQYFFDFSHVADMDGNIEVNNPPPENNPLIMIDGHCNSDHITILGGRIESRNLPGSSDSAHGTAVASLMVCGTELTPNGNVNQHNNIITVEAPLNKLEECIKNTVEELKEKYPLLLINLSINEYNNQYYNRSKISKLSILLDELSHNYNCIFFISVGNSFYPSDTTWLDTMTQACMTEQYPNYFKLDFTNIMPPSDSINNIAVGAITNQASRLSIAHLENPSPITRKNINGNNFIKPDLVHYDGNWIINNRGDLESEGNGVYMADKNDDRLNKMSGTSFASPLVAHDAGILHNYYPEYSNNTIKGLLIHFAREILPDQIMDNKLAKALIGFGIPDIEMAKNSLSYSSTIVIEDEIKLNQIKKIKFPIPSCIGGSSRKRLKIKGTLVYNPLIYPNDSEVYNPINLSMRTLRMDGKVAISFNTTGRQSMAFQKSNVKKYKGKEFSTTKNTGGFWEIEIKSECKLDNYYDNGYKQKYSIIITIEDLTKNEEIDLYQEISTMIEIINPIEVGV